MKIYSNATEVELFINGQSLGKHTGENRVFRWTGATLRSGENKVRATAVVSGQTISDECVWQLTPRS